MKLTFEEAVFLIFLFLKLANFITWSWWWVTAPLWIPALVGIVVFLVVTIVKRR